MVKLRNYNVVLKLFKIILTFSLLVACSNKRFVVSKIEGKEININNKSTEVVSIESFIKPYRDKIDSELNVVLCNAPQTIDKSGEWQTPMGNFLADITFEKANKVFQQREQKNADICILNSGGIRSIIPKGDLNAKNAYEIMPFENIAVVLELKAEQVIDIANYIIQEKKPHPLSGMTFSIDKDNKPKNIMIKGVPIDTNKTYYVITSDYLSFGNDNMTFLKKAVRRYDVDYKLRDIIIDYFKENKTIIANKDVRISKEN